MGDLIRGNVEGSYCRAAIKCLYTVVHNVFKFMGESNVFIAKKCLATILKRSSQVLYFFNSCRICRIYTYSVLNDF